MEHIPKDPYPATPVQPRQTPMKVLCLGPSRTATMSTWVALKRLGYTPYHAVEAGLNANNRHYSLWADALRAKYEDTGTASTSSTSSGGSSGGSGGSGSGSGAGRRWQGASDFDRVLWRYDAITDIPAVLFVDELLEAYPDAKVVLQLRDPQSWAKSVVDNFGYVLSGWWRWTYLKAFDKNMADFHYILTTTLNTWSNGDPTNLEAFQRGLLAHNDHVRSTVAQERLLEWSAQEGWEPLCRFLGKEPPSSSSSSPEEPFPRINEQGFTRGLLDWVLFASILRSLPRVLLKVVLPGAAVAAAGGVWWLWYS